jgi:hypothetical protein
MKWAIRFAEQKELSSTTGHNGRGTLFGISVAPGTVDMRHAFQHEVKRRIYRRAEDPFCTSTK